MNHSPTNHTQYIIYLVISIDWFASRLDFVLTNQQIRLVSYRGIASFFVFPLEIWNQSFVLPKKEGGGGRKRLPFHVISSNTIYRNPPPHHHQHVHKCRYLYADWLCKGTQLCVDILNKILQISAPRFVLYRQVFVPCSSMKSPDFVSPWSETDEKHVVMIESQNVSS